MHPTPATRWRETIDPNEIQGQLERLGIDVLAPPEMVKDWGRSRIYRVGTSRGLFWVKYAYRLPPGEEHVLKVLSSRWADRLPGVVATWSGAVALESLAGEELTPEHPLRAWTAAAEQLGELCARERAHADEWLALGVRDRRTGTWTSDLESLAQSDVLNGLSPEERTQFEALLPVLVDQFLEWFAQPATLVAQDSGCCNIHIDGPGTWEPGGAIRAVFFDWADVVVGHPVFSCDRLLDQVTPKRRDAVIDAFCAPLELSIDEFRAMRQSNVIHEVLRYHDELDYVAPDDPIAESLAKSVVSQIRMVLLHTPR